MKYFIILLFVMAASQTLADDNDDWEAYKVKFNRKYDPKEDQFRKDLFLKSKRMVEEHNKLYEQGLTSWTKGINQFSDRTDAELKTSCIGDRRSPNIEPLTR